MISEKKRIMRVKTVEKAPTRASPYTSYTREPTIDAPTVFAIVLRQSIAEIGRSVFCLSFFNLAAPLTPCSSRPVMNDKGANSAVFLDTYAWVYFKKGDYQMALLYIEQALSKIGSDNAELLEHYGDILSFRITS